MGLAVRPRSGAGAVNRPVQVIYSGAGVSVPSTFLGSTYASPFHRFGATSNGTTVTVDAGTDVLTIASNNGRLKRSEYAVFSSTGTLPSPLVAGVQYPITNKGGDSDPALWTTFQVTSGGQTVDLTSAGSGTHTVRLGFDDEGSSLTIARSLDSSCPTWASVNTSDGVFSWTDFDEYMDYHYNERGRQLLLCLNQTPTWAARDSALDAYGYAGGGQVPTDLTKPAEFCLAAVQRYNKVSAFNPNGVRMIWGIEIWNEPSHSATGTVGDNFCGTVGELAEITRHIASDVLAEDSGCKIIGPGYTSGDTTQAVVGGPHNLYSYLVASDGGGGQAKDHLDGVAFHAYSMNDSQDATSWAAQVVNVRALVTASGLSSTFPLYQTERGVEDTADTYCHARSAVILAALGVQMDITYQWDSFGANPRENSETRNSLETVRSTICGKTLTYCAIMQDGRVQYTANGVTTVI